MKLRGADALAAAGIAPVLRQSAKVRFLGHATVVCQSAFCSLGQPDSRTFGARLPAAPCADRRDRKRREVKRHHQAVSALARRINVLWATLNSRRPFRQNLKLAA